MSAGGFVAFGKVFVIWFLIANKYCGDCICPHGGVHSLYLSLIITVNNVPQSSLSSVLCLSGRNLLVHQQDLCREDHLPRVPAEVCGCSQEVEDR